LEFKEHVKNTFFALKLNNLSNKLTMFNNNELKTKKKIIKICEF